MALIASEGRGTRGNARFTAGLRVLLLALLATAVAGCAVGPATTRVGVGVGVGYGYDYFQPVGPPLFWRPGYSVGPPPPVIVAPGEPPRLRPAPPGAFQRPVPPPPGVREPYRAAPRSHPVPSIPLRPRVERR
jgi:hypothetical protein